MDKNKDYIITVSIGVVGCETEQQAIDQLIDVLQDKRYRPEAIKIEPIN